MNINYQKELDKIIEQLKIAGKIPTLLLHSCCAPCSSYVLEYLSEYFSITIFYYNPNITDSEGDYNPKEFYTLTKGLEEEPEGGARCIKCYYKRLEETAKIAKKLNFDYFTTTLTLSPYKKSDKLNQIGSFLEEKYKVSYLHSDFKKKNGYKKSIELSKLYHLYRQDYCGCIYSKREKQKKEVEVARN